MRTKRKYIQEKSFIPAYNWMKEQMTDKIGSPPQKTLYPVWVWYQWNGTKQRRPDLRVERWKYSKGEKMALIEFMCDKRKILLSDFSLWHYVLNYWYLAVSDEDEKLFGRMYPDEIEMNWKNIVCDKQSATFHKLVRESWQLIFEINYKNYYVVQPQHQKSIQATLWEITIPMVRKVQCFEGARRDSTH